MARGGNLRKRAPRRAHVIDGADERVEYDLRRRREPRELWSLEKTSRDLRLSERVVRGLAYLVGGDPLEEDADGAPFEWVRGAPQRLEWCIVEELGEPRMFFVRQDVEAWRASLRALRDDPAFEKRLEGAVARYVAQRREIGAKVGKTRTVNTALEEEGDDDLTARPEEGRLYYAQGFETLDPEWRSVAAAAEMLDVTPRRVLDLIHEGKLRAQQRAREGGERSDWIVHVDSIADRVKAEIS